LTENKKKQVFVRDATGLVKSVSILDAVTLNLSNMSVGSALALIGFSTILLPSMSGVNIVYASLIAFVLAIPQVIVYTMMSRRIPRTGGDYIWVSRTYGGMFGGALAMMGYTIQTMAYLALIALSAVFAIGSVGVSLGYSNLLNLALSANIGGNALDQFLIASSIFALLIGVNIIKPRFGFKLVSILMILGIVAEVIGIMTLLETGRAGVMNFINSLGSNITYTSVANSYTGPIFSLGPTLLFLPYFGLFVYPWLNAGPSVASELKGKNALRWNVLIASILAVILVTSAFGTMYYVAGFAFTNGALTNSKLVYDFSFNFWTLAMGVAGNSILATIIGLGWILSTVSVLSFGIITISRYLFAHAFDRILPERLAYVSPRYGSPVYAHLIDLIITVGVIAAAAFLYGTLSSLYGTEAGSMTYFGLVGVAAAIYALRHERNSGSKVLLVVAAILMAGVMFSYAYELVANYQIWGGNYLAYGYESAAFLIGISAYLISRSLNKKKNIDISWAFKEIPPE
jgi:amino acid transporter